ncbi:MAG TPA: hypothetical protein VF184_09900 [Phycisphaeraceae bacterium]
MIARRDAPQPSKPAVSRPKSAASLFLATGRLDHGNAFDEEEGRSESTAAASECACTGRPTGISSQDVTDAPESGTRQANE